MNDDVRDQAVRQALERGRQALRAAHTLREAELHDDALSRLYYALFHTLTAVLLSHGIEPRRHRMLISLLGTHLPDRFGAEELAVVARAQTYRDLADYERTWTATAQVVDTAFAETEPLIHKAERMVQGNA